MSHKLINLWADNDGKALTESRILLPFVVGVSGLVTPGGWALGLPVEAVFLGLFLIRKALEKETAKFDEEQRRRNELAERTVRGTKPE